MDGPVGIERSVAQTVTRADSLLSRRYRLGHAVSLHRNSSFQYVLKRGRACPCAHFNMVYLPDKALRFGVTVSKRVGCAVERSRVKRLIRESFRLLQHDIAPGRYVFIARPKAAQADYATISKSVRYALHKSGLFTEESGK